MNKTRFFLTTSGLLIAFVILGVSLSSVGVVQSSDGSTTRLEFSMTDRVLPNHVAYPVLMTLDRVRLETVPPIERIYVQTEYANRRLEYALALVELGQDELAVTTLTKAQKYLLHAGGEVLNQEMTPSLYTHVRKTIQYHIAQSTRIAELVSGNQRAVIDTLNQELLVMVKQLESKESTEEISL